MKNSYDKRRSFSRCAHVARVDRRYSDTTLSNTDLPVAVPQIRGKYNAVRAELVEA